MHKNNTAIRPTGVTRPQVGGELDSLWLWKPWIMQQIDWLCSITDRSGFSFTRFVMSGWSFVASSSKQFTKPPEQKPRPPPISSRAASELIGLMNSHMDLFIETGQQSKRETHLSTTLGGVGGGGESYC